MRVKAAWVQSGILLTLEHNRKYRDGQGEEDVKHLNKILNASYVLYAIGLLTAGFAQLPWNPISALCLSTAICARWTMVGHHVSHGGYSKEVGIEHRFHRANFARGPWRRFVDWCDWMQPEAWDVEHNFMHHVSGMAPMSRCLE